MRILAILLLFAICGCREQSTPKSGGSESASAPINASEWTHKELLDYLNQHGCDYVQYPTIYRGAFGGKGSNFVNTESKWSKTADTAEQGRQTHSPDVVNIILFKTVQEAKDDAGTLGDKGFSWSRFCFRGDPKTLKQIQSKLP